ncbi:MAG: vanadium-dependent haloperoxidase [Caldilineaceae bacterium]
MNSQPNSIEGPNARPPRLARRQLLALGGGLATTALLTGLAQTDVSAQAPVSPLPTPASSPAGSMDLRTDMAYRLRLQAAQRLQDQVAVTHPTNGDEARYPTYIGNFSKGLPHNALGEVEPAAYQALVEAMLGRRACETIPLGGQVKLANPQAAFAFHLEGMDTHNLTMPPAPTFAGIEIAAEMVELYWQALTRDVPFAQYGQEPLTQAALTDLQRFPAYSQVDGGTLFRGATPGDWTGPYLSQFLYLPVPYGALTIDQRYRAPVAGDDHVTDFAAWLALQDGMAATQPNKLDPMPRYLRTARDLSEYVYTDFTHQAYLNAALILNQFGKEAMSPSNPYRQSANQGGFVTFGVADVLSMVTGIACAALKAAWAQKWLFHRRLRPEAFGGRIQQHRVGQTSYPLHEALFETEAVARIYNRFGSYLLPQAYPEGAPTHPAYPAGHATIAGACVTLLKACYNEAFVLPEPQIPSADGLALTAYTGRAALTIGGELNKLAANMALGRNAAGVHWRSDSIQGLLLGEALATSVLADLALTYHEAFDGFTFTRFDGRKVVVGGGGG